MSLVIFGVIGVVIFAVLWKTTGGASKYRSAHEATIQQAADKQREALEIAFAGVHDYREATERDWPGFDRAWYTATTKALEGEGFALIGDIVDDTLRKAFPNMRHVLRVMLGDGGRVRVGFVQVRVTGVARLFQIIGILPRRLRTVDCVSELDGVSRFVATTSSLGVDRMTLPEAVNIERLPTTTSPTAVLTRHRERVSAHERSVFVVMTNAAEVLQSVQRGNVLVARYREGVGPLTEEELVALRGRPLNANEELFLKTLRRDDG